MQIQQSGPQVAEILEQISDAFVALDSSARFTFINRAAEELLGRPRERLLGRVLWEEFPDAVGTTLHRHFDRLLREGGTLHYEEYHSPTDGWFRVRAFGTPGALAVYFQRINEQKHQQQALRDSEDRFLRIFENGPLGIAILGPDGCFQRINSAFCRMLGHEPGELLGRRWQDITHPQDVAAGEQGLALLLRGQTPVFRTEKRYMRKDGAIRWGAATISTLGNGGPGDARRLVMVEDITERKRIDEERAYLLNSEQAARAEAEAANRRKDQFLAVLSHELRTPLTPALARLELLRRDPAVPAHVRSSLNMIRRNIELEARLIDDLLDLTRISRGKLKLALETIDAHQKIRNALDIYQSEISAKDLRIVLDLAARQHFVRADGARLEQVFWNLVSNAVKYTPLGGTITIRTRNEVSAPDPAAAADGDAAVSFVAEVADTGIGMDADIMARLFTAFEQAEQSLTRRFGGLGLGLSICKALIDLHGGHIGARSEGANRGSTFTVDLPAADGPAPDEAAGPEQRPPLRILLVEDNQDTLRILARLLRGMGHQVHTAASVQAARDAASGQSFDLLISDIGLPDGSGWELMRQLRTLHPIRGVALSGFGTDQDIERSREAGFVAHLTKPIDINRLDEVIGQACA